ncbi:MAG TPA: L-threonylcarbamoyladenylate synthase [bacterium]|nr:L-threonylcarbamoyladenylate synthase [bacterium]
MSDIQKAAQIIQEGGIVAFPTETVYGLGADALNPYAVARVFEVKNRPQFDPLIVHVADLRQAEILVTKFPDKALKLAGKFWPGPLTIVLPKSPLVPDIVTSSLPTVAIRVPNHPMALELIRESGRPIAAPSANPFGAVSPTTAEHVRRSLGNKVDLILDGGPCQVGVESTVISLTRKDPVLLRPGGVSLEDLQAVLGRVDLPPATDAKPQAPGQLENHYAPRTALFLDKLSTTEVQGKKIGLLVFQEPPDRSSFEAVEVLSPQGDLKEAAANLFAAVRRLDEKGLDFILARPVPQEGLGRAINDRLSRASRQGTTLP